MTGSLELKKRFTTFTWSRYVTIEGYSFFGGGGSFFLTDYNQKWRDKVVTSVYFQRVLMREKFRVPFDINHSVCKVKRPYDTLPQTTIISCLQTLSSPISFVINVADIGAMS